MQQHSEHACSSAASHAVLCCVALVLLVLMRNYASRPAALVSFLRAWAVDTLDAVHTAVTNCRYEPVSHPCPYCRYELPLRTCFSPCFFLCAG